LNVGFINTSDCLQLNFLKYFLLLTRVGSNSVSG
jgi:hypothetical protein